MTTRRPALASETDAGSTTITVDADGTVRDIDGPLNDEPRALVIREPDRLATAPTPKAMIAFATDMATALKDIVERQQLFTTIRGKKYPHVEAWMTIARMDNVVCREVPDGIVALEDGSYEATVELIRLADGLVIGRGSAICGAPNDGEWTGRAAHMKRSMAVTRATSRAFRQQYSWIMALAGYQPTPADEMPDGPEPPPPPKGEVEELVGINAGVGTIQVGGAATTKLEVRETPEGPAFGFYLKAPKGEGDNMPQVIVKGDLAAAVIIAEGGDPAKLKGRWCRVRGRVVSVREAGKAGFFRMYPTEFETRDYKVPAETHGAGPSPDAAGVPSAEPTAEPSAPSVPMFGPDDEAELDAAVPR